jgi:cell division protein ZapB
MSDAQFKALEQKIDDLIKLCAELNQENMQLKAEARNWAKERETLLARNQTARVQVETILSRLKSVEQTK